MTDSLDSLLLRDFRPRPTRILSHEGAPARPRFRAIDAHNHLGGAFGDASGDWPGRPVSELVALMDEAGVERVVDLDGRFGDLLVAEIARVQAPYPNRFAVFAGINEDNIPNDPAFGEAEAERLRQSAALGARGLKIWKTLGLHLRDESGRLIPVDDRRLDPLWETAADLGLPVMIHIADPVAFFQPANRHNERIEELAEHPDWHFWPLRERPDGPGFPPFDEVYSQFERLVARHRRTTSIGAHVGCLAEDLGRVSRLLAACPNLVIDPSAWMAELGRQPYTSREFFITWQDRILFGSDAAPDLGAWQRWWRFLETRDEDVPYGDDPERPGAGRWNVHCLHLPDETLRRIYRDNALRIIFREEPESTISEETS